MQRYNTKGCPTGSLEERFWRKVSKTDTCWVWGGALSTSGYGVLQRGARGQGLVKAHRLSMELHGKAIPKGKLACHTCNNKLCVNPMHLYAGTYSDNILDAWRDGRRKPRRKRTSNIYSDSTANLIDPTLLPKHSPTFSGACSVSIRLNA